MTTYQVNGLRTILTNTELVRMKNTNEWQQDCRKLKERLRGNGWTVFKRLMYDYRNHLGNGTRARKKQMPYVENGYLYTSPALITHAEAKCMANVTVTRWIEKLMTDFELGGEHFVLEHQPISRDCIRLKLNENFFVLIEQNKDKKQDKRPKKPPKEGEGHIDVKKLAKKFNRKHHTR